MIIGMTTQDFTQLDTRGKRNVFSEFMGHKVDEICGGAMTNAKWGEFVLRHEQYAYSKVKVEPTEDGRMKMTIYNNQTKEWLENPEN